MRCLKGEGVARSPQGRADLRAWKGPTLCASKGARPKDALHYLEFDQAAVHDGIIELLVFVVE